MNELAEVHDDDSRDQESTLQRDIEEETMQRTMEMRDDLRAILGTLRQLVVKVAATLREHVIAVNIVTQNARNIPDIDFSIDAVQAIREGILMVQDADENDITESERREGLSALQENLEAHMRVTRLMERSLHFAQIGENLQGNIQRAILALELSTDINMATLTDQGAVTLQDAAQKQIRALKENVGVMGSSMRALRLQVNKLCNEDATTVQTM